MSNMTRLSIGHASYFMYQVPSMSLEYPTLADGVKSNEKRPATIIDVAKVAGVSFKTVSRVLNGETNVRSETREKVRKAVKELEYRPNHNARNLRARKSRLIAVLFSNPSRNYLGEIQWGALQQCQQQGYNLISEDCSDSERALLALRSETEISGVVITPPLSDDQELLQALDDQHIPYVRIGAEAPFKASLDVGINDFAAAKEMTEYLIGLGHKRIAFINGPTIHTQARKRWEGYCHAIESHGLNLDSSLIVPGEFNFDSGLSAAQKLFELSDRPTAIFACNDDMAAGVLAFAYRHHISIPEDLSVVGFDDTPLASTIVPALTTVYQPSAELASEAVKLLLESLSAPDEAHELRIFDYKLMRRESSGPPAV